MKRLIMLFIPVLILTNCLISQQGYLKDKFYVGYHHNGLYWPFLRQWSEFQNLNVNMMEVYGYHWDQDPYDIDGGFNDSIGNYINNVNTMISDWGTNMQTRALYTEREKVLRAGFGQQSDYEAEANPFSISPGYGWEYRSGQVYNINGVSGIYLSTLPPEDNTPRWVLTTLYENTEQINWPGAGTTNSFGGWELSYRLSDNKQSGWRWFSSPRMKISVSDAFGSSKPVCRIVVVPYNGDTINSGTLKIDLFTTDFRDKDGNYNGQYIDIFYRQGTLLDLSVLGYVLNQGNTALSDGKSSAPYSSQVDYRIYWYGEVDVWLDRVRVEDEWSFYLFHPDLEDPFNPEYDFIDKIHEEVTQIGNNGSFGYFYMDEHMYNSIPCIAEVNRLIKLDNPYSGLVCEVNTGMSQCYWYLKNPPTQAQLFERYRTSSAVTDLFFMFIYPFVCIDENGEMFLLPHNLTMPDKEEYPGTEYYLQLQSWSFLRKRFMIPFQYQCVSGTMLM